MKGCRLAILLVILCAVAFPFIYNFVSLRVPERVPYSPDENDVLFISERISANHTIYWTSELNQRFDVSIFKPRHLHDVGDYRYTSMHATGFVFILAAARKLFLIDWVIPLFALAGVYGVYLLVRRLYDETTALLAAALYALLPSVAYYSNTYFNAIPSITVFIFALFSSMGALQTGKRSYFVSAGILFAASIWIREMDAVFIVPYVLILAVINRRRLDWRALAWGIGAFALCLLPLLLYHKAVFGGYLATGQSVGSADTASAVIQPPFDPGMLIHAARVYLVSYSPILCVLGIIGAVLALHYRRNRLRLSFLAANLVTAAVLLAFYGSRNVFGYNYLTLHGSFARYFLPIYLFMVIYASLALRFLSERGRYRVLAAFLVFALVVSFAYLTFAPINSLTQLGKVIGGYSQYREDVETLPEDALIFTATLDKVIFPARMVATGFTKMDTKELVGIVDQLITERPVYTTEGSVESEFARQLIEGGFVLTKQEGIFPIWKIDKPEG